MKREPISVMVIGFTEDRVMCNSDAPCDPLFQLLEMDEIRLLVINDRKAICFAKETEYNGTRGNFGLNFCPFCGVDYRKILKTVNALDYKHGEIVHADS